MSSIHINGVTDSERTAIETLYRTFNEGNLELLDNAVVPEWVDTPLAPHQAPGRDGIKPLIKEFKTAFPDLHIKVHEMIGAAGRVAVRAEITGTHKGDWFGVAATGKSFSIAIHEFHYVENGLITHTWHLEDWFGWFAQVGASPQG